MALDDDVLFSGVAALSRRIQARELSPVELAEAYLARIDALGPALGCFVTVTRDRALADARAAEADLVAGRWRGPLHGVPYGLKDLVDTAGIRTTFGARPYADRAPERDATVARRLAEAGGVLLGKLSMIELAGGLGYHTGEAALNGPCRTPWDPTRWAGGSSSGAGAAVAAGLVPFAIGSETWGSITCPAAFCGVTGLRPTYGVLSRAGAMALSYTLDKLGPMARTAEDCALVLGVLSGVDPRDPTSIAPPPGLGNGKVRGGIPRGLRVAVLGFPEKPAVAPGARAAYEAAQAVLRDAGAILTPAALPDLPYEPLASFFIEAEAATAFEELIRSGRTRELADRSHATRKPDDYLPKGNPSDYVRAMRVRGEVQRALAGFFARYDLVLAPNLPYPPPRVTENFDAMFAFPDLLGAAGNLAGLPAVALPMGLVDGLPVSMQLVGAPLEEARVLAAAAVFQSRTDHHLARPKLARPSPPSARAGGHLSGPVTIR
ncbi:Amidase [Anaeromyxobacter dehalogenans 2CP-1]|uniref:Amidase n=1 Tax=Anaeromyxobacter dehalogenans (strain ATCC BAA-258 / DSM 21875 / 2CP-1) TaxID=455488 RepID=B8J9J8_ANAD2|nr:amidase [Anaeromyxobacter dehalogenans]ACL67386.1 Amidase [Anaeromyxobacter dehalogenans 2CP-1]